MNENRTTQHLRRSEPKKPRSKMRTSEDHSSAYAEFIANGGKPEVIETGVLAVDYSKPVVKKKLSP